MLPNYNFFRQATLFAVRTLREFRVHYDKVFMNDLKTAPHTLFVYARNNVVLHTESDRVLKSNGSLSDSASESAVAFLVRKVQVPRFVHTIL